MNEIVNKILLSGDKFMPEMHLKRRGFTYSVCGPFRKNKERIEKFMQTGNTDFIYKNELGKACFQHDVAYVKSKDLAKRNQSDKVLRDKAFKIASDPEYDGYQRGLASVAYKFFVKCLVEVRLLLRLQINVLPNQISNVQINFISKLLETLKEEKFIHPETISGVLI